MTRNEIIRLAKECHIMDQRDDYLPNGLERFTHLVAAKYKQDAKRYRWLRDMHDSGDPEWFVYAANPEEPLDAAIDVAMEKTK